MTDEPQLPVPIRHTGEERVAELGALVAEAEGLSKASRAWDPEGTARRFARYETDVLFGIVGAAAGGITGVALASAIGLTAAATGIAGVLAGAAIAILVQRGVGQWRLVRAKMKLETALEIVKRELEWASNQNDVPRDRLNGLWRRYFDLISAFQVHAMDSINNQDSLLDGLPEFARRRLGGRHH